MASGSDCQQQHLSDKATGRTVKRVQCKRKIKPELYLCCFIKKESSKINVTLPAKKIGNYFPETYSKEQIEEVIFMLLDKWKENREGVADAEDTV